MGIDGTWRRDCLLKAISDNDAVLTVEGSVQGLNLKEFFLLLSSTGLAYRRCELVRVNGTDMDIQLLKGKARKKKAGGPPSWRPLSELRQTSRQPLTRTSESKGHWRIYDSGTAFDLKSLEGTRRLQCRNFRPAVPASPMLSAAAAHP